MPWLWAVILIFTLTLNLSESEARHHRRHPPNYPVLVGTVHCDSCSTQDPAQFRFLPGASVAVECKNVDPIFRQEAVTDRKGEFRVRFPFRENVEGCSVELLRSSVAACAVPAVKTASPLRLKSTARGGVYSPGMLTFRPMALPHFCDKKQSFGGDHSFLPSLPPLPTLPAFQNLPPLPSIPNLPPSEKEEEDGTPTAADFGDKDGSQLPEADFPFPFPPNPLNPPSLLPPNPFLPPPSIFPPIFPTPPPSIFPPIFPAPTPPMFPPLFPPIPFPPLPGSLPPPSPPPPAFPIPLPPFPFQPTPGFPGVPPIESKVNSP